MAEQVTTMVLKANLKCDKCYKKVKKVLCKFPQIRDQVYDDKNDTVTIKVVCCSPEKIKEKIICKGGDCIKCIEIKVPEKPKPKETEKTEKKKEPPPKRQPDATTTVSDTTNPPDKPVERKSLTPPVDAPKPNPPPLTVCCQECYIGYPGGPCFHCHGWPPPSYQCHGYCGCGRNYCVCRCEENSAGCTIM